MNKELRLIYFPNCPNFPVAQNLLNSLGLEYELVNQMTLQPGNVLLNFTSPTLLRGNQIIFGAKSGSEGCTISIPSTLKLKEKFGL